MAVKRKTLIRSETRRERPLPPRRWRVGDLIQDRYEVYDIRAGGIGIVYIVYDHVNRIPYAIKTLQDRHLSNRVAVENFIREAEVWVRLGRHQNIVHAFCVDKIEDRPYIFLECVLGSSLKKVLSGEPLAQRTVLRYAIQFCRGMIHAQEKIPDFAHLDIKPENCMLTQDSILKVTDFSLSRALLEDYLDRAATHPPKISPRTTSTSLAGTFPYMSPEQFVHSEGVGRQSDVYSFGIVLYEMVAGKRPFSGRSAQEWRDVHVKSMPVAPRTMIPSISIKLNDLTMWCLAKNPAERPGDFQVIVKSLQALLWEEFHEEVPPANSEQLESWEYSNMGVSLCHLGRLPQAIAYFDKALCRNPKDPHAWLNRGVALGTLGKGEEELGCYERALAIKPEYAEAWHNKGLALYKLGRFDEAISCYDRSLAINPHQAGVWINKGSVLGGLGRFEEEASCYEKAIGIDPGNATASISRAAALINLGLFEEANACCDRALDIAPDKAEAWVNKASALGALKRFGEAIDCAEKALAIDSHLSEAWVCKGLALQNLGSTAEGDRCIRKGSALDRSLSHTET
jgi:serine/threonine protein kinase